MMMRRLFVLLLLLALGASGATTAVSHLRMALAFETELCADGAMRKVLIGADGEEVSTHHDCTDCMLMVLALAGGGETLPKRIARRAEFPRKVHKRKGSAPRPRGARDPPSL